MAVYYKPQSPIQSGEDFIYPITTADQVILSDGSRLEKNGAINLVTLPTTEETPGEAPTINAGTFGGMTVSQFVEMIYPVGSIYISARETSPETLFGGTWESIGGRFLLGADATYAAGSTGGEATHKLTVNEMPKHVHQVAVPYSYDGNMRTWKAEWTDNAPIPTNGSPTSNTGGDQPHNNMPPYLVVYMWQRTA